MFYVYFQILHRPPGPIIFTTYLLNTIEIIKKMITFETVKTYNLKIRLLPK